MKILSPMFELSSIPSVILQFTFGWYTTFTFAASGEGIVLNRTMDLLFTDSFAFIINKTLGLLLRTKICNYSWDAKANSRTNTEISEN